MSMFAIGGNVGFMVGPLLVLASVGWAGLSATPVLAVPGLVVAGVIAAEMTRLQSFRPVDALDPDRRGEGDDWRAFAWLTGVIAFRSCAYFGLLTIIPLYCVGVLDSSKSTAALALSLMLGGGIIGSLIAGRTADAIGRRPVVIASMAAVPPLISLLLLTGLVATVPLLVVVGAAVIATFSVTIVLGQEYLPTRIGFASGITLGVAIGIGGLISPVLGLIADAEGLRTAPLVIAVLPVVALGCALALPRTKGAPT